MKLYNETHIEERDLVRQVEQWQTQGLVTPEQLAAVRAAYPRRFKMTNPFIDIGLFLFTIIAAMSAFGLVYVLLSGGSGETGLGAVAIVFGIGLFFFTRSTVASGNLCRNGIDNALVLLVPLFLIGGLILLFPVTPPFWACCLIALPILLAMIWYTGDTILTYFALFALYGGLFHRLIDYGWGKQLMPFIFMAVSVGLYLLADRLPNRAYYADVLSQLRWASLVVLAAAGNYYVVRELNGLLLEGHYAVTPEISLRGLFWGITFGIPLAYAVLGFRRKSRMFVILAVLGLAAALVTVRHYYGTWPLSVALAIDGTVLIGLAVLGIRWLRAPRHGFSDTDDGEAPLLVVRHAGTLTTLQGTVNAQQHPTGPRFGGGDFGGGGSGEQY
ncbi:hypothetical protein [Fibrella aquatilis]|uniref:DUF2157 domain-containing protein n=1 Tax=Fibrella aquatilis TaxID=2817059 RepID=A0A939K0Q7_9BACT|nr:hypothetical protein [Fibrella aquatilis]MBO0934449.1 hypothetical protein [Fibrella aquatilis]